MGYTFLSYSRQQLYFAESIALHLQKAGIEVWFDLQQLHAGVTWSDALDRGYENCDRLVLVVSRAALTSQYVEKEWKAVLRNDHEVILAVVEDVSFPEPLRGKPTFDFRGEFAPKMQQLIDCLKRNGAALHDSISAPGFFPSRLPRDIKLITWALTLPNIWAILITWSSMWLYPEFRGLIGVCVAPTATLLGLIFLRGVRHFLQHNTTEEGLDQSLKASLSIVIVVGLYLMFIIFLERENAHGLFWLMIASTVLLLGFNIYMVYRPKSPDVLRWFPPGGASQDFRRQFHSGLLEAVPLEKVDVSEVATSHVSAGINYSLTYDPADLPLAAFVVIYISAVGNNFVSVEQAEKHLFLITNRTSRTLLERFSQEHGSNTIYLLGSSVDNVESLQQAYKTQLIDIRDNDPNDLVVLGQMLTDLEAWRRQAALEVTPKSFQAHEIPKGVSAYQLLGYFSVIVLLANAISNAISGNPFVALFSLVLGSGMYVIVSLTNARRVSFKPAVTLNLIVPILSILLTLLDKDWLLSLEMAGNTVGNVIAIFSARQWFPDPVPIARDAIGRTLTWKYWVREITLMIIMAIFFYFIYLFIQWMG